MCKCTQQFGDVFLQRWWIMSRNVADGIAGYILNTSHESQEKKTHDDNAWGNKRHLPIIMITLLLTNFDFYPSFPIFYSLLENCMNNEKVEKQEHLAQIFIVTFWRISFFFVCWKGSGRAWSFLDGQFFSGNDASCQ